MTVREYREEEARKNMVYDYVITKPELDDALTHYGVPGMRWGHRKQQLMSEGLSYRKARKIYRLEKKQAKAINTINSYADKKINKYKKKMNATSDLSKKKKYENLAKAYELSKKKNSGIENRYSQAKIKAVRDKNYAKSKDYKVAMRGASKQNKSSLLGYRGHFQKSVLPGGLGSELLFNNSSAVNKRAVRKYAKNMNYHLSRGHKIAGAGR